MAAVTLLGAATWNTTAGDKTVTATPAVNDLIVIVAAASGTNETNAATTAVTDNNSSGTYIKLADSGSAGAGASPRITIWVRTALVGSGSSTVFTATQANSSGGGLAVCKVTGMTRVGLEAIRRAGVAFGATSTTPTVVCITPFLTGNACIGGVVNEGNPATLTQPGSWSELGDLGYNSPTSGLQVASRDSGETGSTITWGSTSGSAWRAVAIELDVTALSGSTLGALGVGG